MKLKNPMLVVTDIDRSVEFYKKVFGLHIRTGYYGYKIPSRNLSERSEKMRCEPIENGRAPPNPESGVIGG